VKRVLREAARAVRPALIPSAARSLGRQAARAATVDGAIDLVFGFDFGGIRWSEPRARRPVRELVEDWSQGRFGVGVLRV
jgi:hypothetical protein